MSLIEALNDTAGLVNKFHRRCGMCAVLDNLSVEERAKVVELLQDPEVSKAKLTQVLRSHGHDVKVQVVTRHARGECAAS